MDGGLTSASSVADKCKFPYTLAVLSQALRAEPPGGGGLRIAKERTQKAGLDIPVDSILTADPRYSTQDLNLLLEENTFEPSRSVPEARRNANAISTALQLA
mmetsp:Transcript_9836/g.15399  ORF Transcript_9836/g.15399 Transcript_9836/m.15399 type:complete len:102 (+) Transcript_9836:95-400(+)